MGQKWNYPHLPWNNTAMPWKGTVLPWNSTALSWKLLTPIVTSAAAVSNAENAALAHTLLSDETVTWSITGGADELQFEISGRTLRWAENGTQDFETPADADEDNAYVVEVTATDSDGTSGTQTITVTVTNVAE